MMRNIKTAAIIIAYATALCLSSACSPAIGQGGGTPCTGKKATAFVSLGEYENYSVAADNGRYRLLIDTETFETALYNTQTGMLWRSNPGADVYDSITTPAWAFRPSWGAGCWQGM